MAKARRGRKKAEPEIEQQAAVPAAPEDLGDYGRQYWESLAPQLIELGIWRAVHAETFRVLCELWQEYRSLSVWLAEDPGRMTFITESGYQAETPQVRQRDKALMQLQKLWLKFGLTPHALASLNKQRGASGNQIPAIAAFAKKKYAE